MKTSVKGKLIKMLLYIIGTAIAIEIMMLIPVLGSYDLSYNERINFLIAFPIALGPSLGYGVYRIMENNDRIKEDPGFRRYMIFRTTAEAFVILLPIWGILKYAKLL